MSNINQSNEIEYINKEISLLQDRKKSKSISKCVNAKWKNAKKTRINE